MSLFSDLFTVTVQVSPPDEELRRLNREATEAKKIKDWERAVVCLQLARERMRDSTCSHTLESWLRLPIFLQQAGRFDEAMAEFNLLIQDTKPRIDRELAHALPYARRFSIASSLMRIYDKMRLACQREKLPRETERYAKMSEQQRDIREKLEPLVIAEEKKRSDDYWKKVKADRARK